MNKTVSQRLFEANEPYAAGLFEFPEREPIYRYSNALYRDWENAKIMPYEGGALYPCGKCVGKGNPDIYLRAAEKLGYPPEDCAVFEDIVPGVRGAAAGGFYTVAVYDEHNPNKELLCAISDRYIFSFAEIFAEDIFRT